MERDFRALRADAGISRRAFLSYGVAGAGLLILGVPRDSEASERLADLRGKFREMEGYGIPAFVSWSDPTMRELLGSLSRMDNSLARSGRPERLALHGSTPEEQYRSLNSLIGRAPESPFDPASLDALERRFRP